jgi:MoxR-like ATPase
MEIVITDKMNMYAGTCRVCGHRVAEKEGILVVANGVPKPVHRDCAKDKDHLIKQFTNSGGFGGEVKREVSATTVEAAVEAIAKRMSTLIPELVDERVAQLSRVAEIKIGKAPSVKVDRAHRMLEPVLMTVVAGASPMLVGPAGSGKTTLAEQVAKLLKLNFYMEARVTSEYKLLGFLDATSRVVRTQFREAYENGGVFLFDEMDASDADALTAFNAALSNGSCAFPDKLVKRHKDFYAIAACNTFGRGADRQYVGRNQLDAATLDRFEVLEVDYDEQLELEISGNPEWCRRVQKVRKAIAVEKVRHIVSPRASIMGARMLAAGMDRETVEEACIWKGLDAANRARVAARLGETYNAY